MQREIIGNSNQSKFVFLKLNKRSMKRKRTFHVFNLKEVIKNAKSPVTGQAAKVAEVVMDPVSLKTPLTQH